MRFSANTVTPDNRQPERLFTIPEVAEAIGCHPISLYKAITGQMSMAAPKVVRIGRLVRVRDCDFQDYLNGLSNVKLPTAARPALSPERRAGRPTKAVQIAKREAAARARKDAA